MAGPVVVELVLGRPRREWCERCLSSAVLEIDVWQFHETADGVLVGSVRPLTTVRGCTRCQPDMFTKGR